jgi:cytoskeletal protein CcmA (bactofilin family)
MWKRDEAAKPGGGQSQPAPAPAPVTPAAPPVAAEAARPITSVDTPRGLEKNVNIGKSVIIKGELNGSEDLTIEGLVEGKIELRQNVLTIGPNGKIKAQVFAKSVIILGEVTGNVTATEKVDIRDNGSVDGDIAAPRVAIAEGAHFRGSIDMQRAGGKPGENKPGDTKAGDNKPGENKPADAKAEQKPAPAAAPGAAQPTPAAASR